ncbi:MAG: cytochrome-c peroxidase [Methylococcaceae bacterium]
MKLKAHYDNIPWGAIVLSVLSLFAAKAMAEALPVPVADKDYFYEGKPSQQIVDLGKQLFFDKILSGDKNISCGTCHNPLFGSGDDLSLPIGAGGSGSGANRTANLAKNRIVRNSLALYNHGAKQFIAYSSDGDVMLGANGTFVTPAAASVLPPKLDNLLAAQALFPLTAAREMTGLNATTNPITNCALLGDFTCVWTSLVTRLQGISGYVTLFKNAYPAEITSATGIKIQHVVNAISAYETVAFRSDDSPFDDFLAGQTSAMSSQAVAGMNLFYGSAGCSTCHKGIFQTDHSFHAIAIPQIGPGRRDGVGGKDDGRFRNTRIATDKHKYKTPSLRNVELTGPWGHDGAYTTLEGIIRHHLDPVASLNNYDASQAFLPAFPRNPAVASNDFKEHNDLTARAARAKTNELAAKSLTDAQVDQLLVFMEALTGASVLDVSDKIPSTVPSGLPVAD